MLKAHYRYISGKQFATARLSDIFVSKVNFYNFTVGLANGTRRQRKVESYLDWPQPIQTEDKSRWEIEICKKNRHVEIIEKLSLSCSTSTFDNENRQACCSYQLQTHYFSCSAQTDQTCAGFHEGRPQFPKKNPLWKLEKL